jgi:hypothetical protein
VPLHYYRFFSKRIRFAHGILRVYPFSDARHHRVNNSEYCPPNEILKHHCCEAWSIDHSIIQLSHLMAVKSSETNWRTRRVTGNYDEYHEYKTQLSDPANERNRIRSIQSSSSTLPASQLSTIISPRCCNGVILPLNRQHREPMAKSRDELRVSTVTTTFLLFERSAPISVFVYTYSSSNVEEAHWQKHSTASLRIHYSSEACLRRWTIL